MSMLILKARVFKNLIARVCEVECMSYALCMSYDMECMSYDDIGNMIVRNDGTWNCLKYFAFLL